MRITTNDLKEYRSLKQSIATRQHLLKWKRAQMKILEQEIIDIVDNIFAMKRERARLRRAGAY